MSRDLSSGTVGEVVFLEIVEVYEALCAPTTRAEAISDDERNSGSGRGTAGTRTLGEVWA